MNFVRKNIFLSEDSLCIDESSKMINYFKKFNNSYIHSYSTLFTRSSIKLRIFRFKGLPCQQPSSELLSITSVYLHIDRNEQTIPYNTPSPDPFRLTTAGGLEGPRANEKTIPFIH